MYKTFTVKENSNTKIENITLTKEERFEIQEVLRELFHHCTETKLKDSVGIQEMALHNFVYGKDLFNGFSKIKKETYDYYSWCTYINTYNSDEVTKKHMEKIKLVLGKERYASFLIQFSNIVKNNFE